MSPREERPSSAAEESYYEFLQLESADGKPSFEEFCARHAALADELRAIHALVGRLASGLPGRPLSERLAQHFGSEVDPHVTLADAAEDAAPSRDFSSDVLARLGARRTAFGRYVLKGEIDRGGQGAVVRVWDEDLRRALAMKVLLGQVEARRSEATPPVDMRTLGRFLEEAQVTGQLDHPGIVPVHELGLDGEGRVYFTMKLVKGETFKSVLARVVAGSDGWTRTRALTVLQRVCEAMSYAHHKGVVHRDLKPANVMVGRFGEVYVMDWGLAKVLGRPDARDVRIAPEARTERLRSELRERADGDQDSPLVTMDGDVVGTPAYMPPEQAQSAADSIGPHSDVYAVGALLYHLLAGHMPYVLPGMRLAGRDVLYLVQKGPPEPIAERAPDSPAELLAICERAMARDPAARYASMQELSADLSAFLERRVVAAYETGAWAEARKWVQRNRPLAAALAAAVVLLVAGLATSLEFKRRADAHAAETAEQARIAGEKETLATARAEDVLRLSALQELEDLLVRADTLWPAYPENIPRFERWTAEARALADGLFAHEAKRAELRARALPQTDAERRAELEPHERYPELQQLERELQWRRGALAQRRDGTARELPEPDWSEYPSTVEGLNRLARLRVDPEREPDEHVGEEPLGLVLALRAYQLADSGTLRASIGDTVARAWFLLGLDDEALAASRLALADAPEGEQEDYRGRLARLEASVAEATGQEALEREAQELEALEQHGLELATLCSERRDWSFPEDEREARWWNNQLTKLIDGLHALERGLLASDAIPPEHGWSMPRRLAFARELEAGFAPGGAHTLAWQRALPAIRAAYPELELGPRTGLVPIGPDPDSGLWEFAHLQTGAPAVRGEDGKLVLSEETGLVLVLIPAGTFWMGAQRGNPAGRNYDPDASSGEGPPHEVRLSAYFLSKYELTQGQWLRIAGRNPSHDGPDGYFPGWNREGAAWSSLHPVEIVSWEDCMVLVRRLGLDLPTEAQWERACRADADPSTPWWTGSTSATLAGAANLADAFARERDVSYGAFEDWDDGYVGHARVGSYRPNPFGLHDMHGNVWEWCADGCDGEFYASSPSVDPVAPGRGSATRVVRGGSFVNTARNVRSAHRNDDAPSSADENLGLRPARGITP